MQMMVLLINGGEQQLKIKENENFISNSYKLLI
jgi:hypothetical protein